MIEILIITVVMINTIGSFFLGRSIKLITQSLKEQTTLNNAQLALNRSLIEVHDND